MYENPGELNQINKKKVWRIFSCFYIQPEKLETKMWQTYSQDPYINEYVYMSDGMYAGEKKFQHKKTETDTQRM